MKVYFLIEADLPDWLVYTKRARRVMAKDIKSTLENRIEGELQGYGIAWDITSFSYDPTIGHSGD